MTVPELCPGCGVNLEEADQCPKCGWRRPPPPPEVPQLIPPYVVKRAGDTWVISNETGARLTFKALGSGAAKRIIDTLQLEPEAVERQLAALVLYVEQTKLLEPEANEGGVLGGQEDRSQADLMVELVLSQDAVLFTDQYGNPYIQFPDESGKVKKVYPLGTSFVRDWLAALLYKEIRKVPGGNATSSALSVLRAMAREGPQIPLYNRVAPDGEGGIFIDMANDAWERIHITPKGWDVVSGDRPLFTRHSHQQALPRPVKGGNPMLIFRFTNFKDEEHKLLYQVAGISFLIPEIQHPVLLIWGPHGSGKSITHIVIRIVIDPSIVGLLSLPRNDRELVQQLYHHYCGFYDNLSTLPVWASDIFSRAVTGAGNTKRQLYTDDDDVIYEYRRCLGLNGINVAAQQPDLLDRTIILSCSMLDNAVRMEERVMYRELVEAAPSILGGMLDIIVKALNIYPTIKLGELPRLADFTRWGCAITEALGIDHQLFLNAVENNIKSQSEEALRASLIATALVAFMEIHPDGWSGSPEALYDALCVYAEEHRISLRQKGWPKSSSWMVRRFNEAAPSLKAVGITVETKGGPSRIISIGKTLKDNVNAVMPSKLEDYNDTTDTIDKTSQSFSEGSIEHNSLTPSPDAKPNLQEDLKLIVDAVSDVERETGDAADVKAIRAAINKRGRLLSPNRVNDLIEAANKSRLIFSPRPGYWRVCV